jgi:hypothetical protein
VSAGARTRSRRAPGALLALLALLLACRGEGEPGEELTAQTAEPAAGYLLTPLQPSAAQAVSETSSRSAQRRFVEIEVERVLNPQRVPLSFDVHYLPRAGERVLLGTFSLFPPDRPGSFIVATSDKVSESGELEVSLRALEPPAAGAALQVRIGPLRFR